MQDSILLGLLLAIGVFMYAVGAVGSAALMFLWFPKLARPSGALLASLPTPSIIAAFLLSLAWFANPSSDATVAIGAMAVVGLPGLAVGYPCALLTLRALDRRVERAGVKAQEIFE